MSKCRVGLALHAVPELAQAVGRSCSQRLTDNPVRRPDYRAGEDPRLRTASSFLPMIAAGSAHLRSHDEETQCARQLTRAATQSPMTCNAKGEIDSLMTPNSRGEPVWAVCIM